MTAKETAVTLPLLLLACEWILRDGKEPRRLVLARWLPFAALVLLWPLRLFLDHGLTVRGGWALASQQAGFTPLQYLLIESRVLLRYLTLALLPFPLHFPHDPVALVRGGPPDIPPLLTALSAMTLLALAAWALFGPARHRLPRLGAALFLASQALESSVFPLWDIAATHRCYPGLLGLGLVFAWALTLLPRPCARLAALALALFAALTLGENRLWSDPGGLYARDLRHAWHAGVNWGNCAWTCLETGHPEAARRVARQGVRLPYNPRVGSAYVTALLALGRNEEARVEIARVKGLAEPLVWLRLATLETLQAGDPERIEALMREAEDLNLAQPELALWLARHRDSQGRKEEAEALLRRYLKIHPDHPLLWDHLGYLLLTQQRFGESEAAYRQAVLLDPAQPKAQYHLGLLALKRGDLPAAEAAFREALRAKPDYALARRDLEALLARFPPLPPPRPPRLASPSGAP
jgi:tetratricopeptide (TPR) repeat protein